MRLVLIPSAEKSSNSVTFRTLLNWAKRLGLALAVALFLGYLPFEIYGEKGIKQYLRLKKELGKLRQRNTRLVHRINRLRREIRALRGDHTILFTKSVLDGFTSLALASTYGFGVFFLVIPLFLFQASITLLANLSQDFFSTLMITQLTAVGGAMIIGIGINLLDIKQIRIINLLPALIWVILFTRFFPGIW